MQTSGSARARTSPPGRRRRAAVRGQPPRKPSTRTQATDPPAIRVGHIRPTHGAGRGLSRHYALPHRFCNQCSQSSAPGHTANNSAVPRSARARRSAACRGAPRSTRSHHPVELRPASSGRALSRGSTLTANRRLSAGSVDAWTVLRPRRLSDGVVPRASRRSPAAYRRLSSGERHKRRMEWKIVPAAIDDRTRRARRGRRLSRRSSSAGVPFVKRAATIASRQATCARRDRTGPGRGSRRARRTAGRSDAAGRSPRASAGPPCSVTVRGGSPAEHLGQDRRLEVGRSGDRRARRRDRVKSRWPRAPTRSRPRVESRTTAGLRRQLTASVRAPTPSTDARDEPVTTPPTMVCRARAAR